MLLLPLDLIQRVLVLPPRPVETQSKLPIPYDLLRCLQLFRVQAKGLLLGGKLAFFLFAFGAGGEVVQVGAVESGSELDDFEREGGSSCMVGGRREGEREKEERRG